MDFQRARRNLQLLQEPLSGLQDGDPPNDDENGSSFDLGASTQVPDSLGLGMSSAPAPEEEDVIFVNTQIQGRLDDIEHENTLRSRLKQYSYPQEPVASHPECKRAVSGQGSQHHCTADMSTHTEHKLASRAKPRPKAKAVAKSKTNAKTKPKLKSRTKTESVPQLGIDAHEFTKTELLLKQLSGKHNKIKDILRSQKTNVSKATKKKRQPVTYDIYNAQEWRYIYQRLMETFPQTEQTEVSEVYRYLYGETTEENLWASSHLPPESYKNDSLSTPVASLPKESQQVTIMSLSQVMSDDFLEGDYTKDHVRDSDTEKQEEKLRTLLDESKKEQGRQELVRAVLLQDQLDDQAEPEKVLEEDNISIVSNSTDESVIVIPVETQEALKVNLDHEKTPALPPPKTDEIIDLTRSFKAVQCLISPLKTDDAPSVQVPATRTSTVTAVTKPAPNPSTMHVNLIKLRILKSQLSSLEASLAAVFTIHSPASQDQSSMVPPTDAEDNDFENHCLVQLEPVESCEPRSCNDNVDSQLASQSAIKLRQSLKEIGLKPSRSKSQMIASLKAASQTLDSKTDTDVQRKEIYDLLTSLVQSSPSLHEKVYTFQPIFLEDLLRQLIVANPFVDYVNEAMIREWADMQGICLKNS